MPHEPFEAVFDLLFVQIRQRLADGLKRERVHFESNRFIRIPIAAQVRTARGHLNDGNRRLDMAGDLACKAQFRSHDIVHRRQRLPTLRARFILPPEAINKLHLLLRRIQSGVRRKAFDVLHLRIRPHHVRLAGEDKDTQGFLVIIGLGECLFDGHQKEDCD